jgi:hypothetical protein
MDRRRAAGKNDIRDMADSLATGISSTVQAEQ